MTEQLELSDAITRNLLAVYYRANSYDLEAANWYSVAHTTCKRLATKYRVTLPAATGVMAALSPGNDWQRNVVDAETLISEFKAGVKRYRMSRVGTYGRNNVSKALACLEGDAPLDVLGGPKVRAFYSNMMYPLTSVEVTVDRHAKCAAYGLKNTANSVVRANEYDYIAAHFAACAATLGLVPNAFQAIVWVTWRRLDGILGQQDLFE